MDKLLLNPATLKQLNSVLLDTVKDAVKMEVEALFTNLPSLAPPAEYLTRKETAKLLGVSLHTLNDWTKEGLVIGYRIGSRVRYKRTELERALVQIRAPKTKGASC